MDISEAATFICSAEANTLEPIQSRVSLKKKSIYTSGRAHITSKHTVFIQIYKKEKEKIQQNKYMFNTRHREISVPTGATTMQSNRKAETRMNAVTPHPVYDLIYLKYME